MVFRNSLLGSTEIQNQSHHGNTETQNTVTDDGENRVSTQPYHQACLPARFVGFASKLSETVGSILVGYYTNSTHPFVQWARVDEDDKDCSQKNTSLPVKPNPDSASGTFASRRQRKHQNVSRDSDARVKRTISFTKAWTLFVCTFSLALSCYVRPDGVLLVCAFIVPYLRPNAVSQVLKRESVAQRAVLFLLGTATGLIAGVVEDFYFYGVGVISPVNWLKFNVLSNATSQFFGTDSARLYFEEILVGNSGMVFLLGINFVGLAASAVRVLKAVDFDENRARLVRRARLLASVLSLLVLYSLQRHKELRFVHHVIVLYLVFSAANILSVAMTVARTFSQIVSRPTALCIILLCSWSQLRGFPTVHDGTLKHWVYRGAVENYDVTKCLNFIASQNDVRGVFFDKNIHVIGGYTFLRHDVPVLTLTFSGYHEYGFSSRTSVDRKLSWQEPRNISVVTSSKLSNYFSQQNKQYLLQYLIAQEEYNYLVMDAETDFLRVGYKLVFTSGLVKVVKRVGTEVEEKRLSDVVPFLKFEAEADVLQSEARQLYAFGLKELAASRFSEAMKKGEKLKV